MGTYPPVEIYISVWSMHARMHKSLGCVFHICHAFTLLLYKIQCIALQRTRISMRVTIVHTLLQVCSYISFIIRYSFLEIVYTN